MLLPQLLLTAAKLYTLSAAAAAAVAAETLVIAIV